MSRRLEVVEELERDALEDGHFAGRLSLVLQMALEMLRLFLAVPLELGNEIQPKGEPMAVIVIPHFGLEAWMDDK